MFTLRMYFETEDTANFIYRTQLLQERETAQYEKAKNQYATLQGNTNPTLEPCSYGRERVQTAKDTFESRTFGT